MAMATLMGCMALPSVVNLVHAIYQHQELECGNDSRIHFHEAEFDCTFQKFKNTTPLYFTLEVAHLWIPRPNTVHHFPHYAFLGLFEGLSFSLRGPPSLS